VRTDVVLLSDEGDTRTLASLEDVVDNVDRAVIRFNDAKCDRNGRLVAGWLALDQSRLGGVVRIDGDGSVERLLDGVAIANGMDWNPDGTTYYLIDSMTMRVDAFDYDQASGRLVNRRPVVVIEHGIGAPDGMTVDHEACLWVAIPYSSQVRRYSPEGALLQIIDLPTPKGFSCGFGGPAGDELFITTGSIKPSLDRDRGSPASMGVDWGRIKAAYYDEAGGSLLACRPGVSGPAATPFAG
jgi:sugar lactone lactonase YvrE